MTDFLASFHRVKRTATGASAACPAHDDANNSLSIARGTDGRWLLKCHAGCSIDAILDAARLTKSDLFPGAASSATSTIVAKYDYHAADGGLLYQVVRYAPKTFRPRRPDGAGGWTWNLNGTARVLYHLPELQGQRRVWLVEGEKDADRLRAAGFPATTNAFGAGKWIADYVQQLTAAGCRELVMLPDNDPPGATHGRMVARSCADAGIAVKLIALPDLPDKGDVSDYLTRHTAPDLLALVDAAAFYRGDQRVADPPAFALTTIGNFLDEPDDAIDWIVRDRIPAGAVVLFVGAPKAGKSTAVRELAVAVARGASWLGWTATRGAVWLLAFEDKRSEIRRHLRQLGASLADPLRLFVGQAPGDLLPRLQGLAATDPPAVIILDTVARALRVKDVNDYAQVSTAFEPWIKLARTTGATLLLVHHASAHADRDGLHAILGSTAFAGSADNVIVLRRVDGQRVLSSTQRIGPDLDPTIITLDAATGRLVCAGTKRLVDDQTLRDRILAALRDVGEPITESSLHDQVDGRKTEKVRALRVLLSQQRVVRTGKGGRGDPFLYRLPDPCDGAVNTGSQTSGESARSEPRRDPAGTRIGPIKPDLFSSNAILVPAKIGPIVRGTSSEVRGSKKYKDLAILVPAGSEIAQTDALKTAKTPDKTESDSGSQISENDGIAPDGLTVPVLSSDGPRAAHDLAFASDGDDADPDDDERF